MIGVIVGKMFRAKRFYQKKEEKKEKETNGEEKR